MLPLSFCDGPHLSSSEAPCRALLPGKGALHISVDLPCSEGIACVEKGPKQQRSHCR